MGAEEAPNWCAEDGDCFVCGSAHCEGEDFGTGMTDDDPDGCFCPACEPCRKRFGLEDWWESLAWRDPARRTSEKS